MSEVPNKIRNYDIYNEMKQKLKDYGKMKNIIDNLKTEAIKPRHWQNILKKMKVSSEEGYLWESEREGNKIYFKII